MGDESHPAMGCVGAGGALPVRRPSWGWLFVVFLLLMALQVMLYSESFEVGPASDDFGPPLAEIWRGQAEGPWALVRLSDHPPNYTPLQSLVMWTAGNNAPPGRLLLAVHILHFAGMAVLALAGAMWLRVMPVSRLAALCGGVVLFVHPALAAPLAGIDAFSLPIIGGLTWIAVYIVWRGRERLARALPLALLIFIVNMGFVEHALGTVPLSCLVVMVFARSLRQAFGRALIVGTCFSIVVLGIVFVRAYTIPPHPAGESNLPFPFSPVTWMKNLTLFCGMALFPGSSTWVFVNRSAVVIGITALSIITVGLTLLLALRARYRGAPGDSEVGRWIAFAALAIGPASFPSVLLPHVSELYVTLLVLPLAMLVAMAADGARQARPRWRALAAIVFLGSILWAALAVRGKVHDLRQTGERAAELLQQVADFIPEEARDLTIAVCYPPAANPPRGYSVFRTPDELLIAQPWSLSWLRPHRGLWIAFPTPTLDEALAQAEKYALIVQWNRETQRMEVMHSNLPVR